MTAFSTALFAREIACDNRHVENDPSGSIWIRKTIFFFPQHTDRKVNSQKMISVVVFCFIMSCYHSTSKLVHTDRNCHIHEYNISLCYDGLNFSQAFTESIISFKTKFKLCKVGKFKILMVCFNSLACRKSFSCLADSCHQKYISQAKCSRW